MSPRPYRMGRRQEMADETRHRIITAARELLAARQGPAGFSVDAVAERAGVARMTVYYQFGSKEGLLEGLCDTLAVAGGMARLAGAFRLTDPLAALDEFIAVFMRFWQSDRSVLRGLGGLAVLDPDFAKVLERRSGRRREGLRVLVGRIAKQTGRPEPRKLDDAVDLLYTLTSFQTFDMLASSGRKTEQVRALIQGLARRVIEQ